MKNFKIFTVLMCTAGFALQAGTVALGTSTDDTDNYGTFSAQTLSSVTLNGITYDTSDLVQVTLTAWKGASVGQFLQYNNGPVTLDEAARRAFLETDWSGNTGIINPSTSAGSAGFNFNTPVKNIAGADMFLYEINSSTPDSFQITIDGTTVNVTGAEYGNSGTSTANADVINFSNAPSNLTNLLTNTTTSGSNNINQTIHGVGIDFSDFGIALGATVSSFTLNSSSSGATFDPVIIAAVPEPASLWLLSLAAVAMVVVKRRK
ncbi:PEP-CTERM sorting domain-containing protein [Kiritimatiellaeota bacterium B1221]|nr:PEP-CTERM sorting domain-containing protein [Kiritimatiellaeota bacterium B1221]